MTDASRKMATEANRAAWNASAGRHRDSDRWLELVRGFAEPGFSTFDPTITALLQDIGIAGKSLVQIGCNNGREVLSARALGADPVCGIEQAHAFLQQAEELNRIAGADCTFVAADIFDLPGDTPRDFDTVLVTIGVLNWMPSLKDFFAVAAGLLVSGGRIILYETHPVLEMFDPMSATPFEPTISYFREEPIVRDQAIVYDGSSARKGSQSYWFVHTLADVIGGAIAAGLAIERFEEFGHSNREVDYDVYRGRNAQLPMCYTLVARKPA